MWWIFRLAYAFICNSALDFVIFILVDVVAKSPLRDARSEAEKRKIWLYESLVLVATSLLVYLLDHTPYFLLLLTFLTFIYTQLLGRVDFRHLWRQLMTRWEESQHVEDNVKLINEQMKFSKRIEMLRKQNFSPPVSKPVLKRLSEYVFRNQAKPTMNAAQDNSVPINQQERRVDAPVPHPGPVKQNDSFTATMPYPVQNPVYNQPMHSTPIYSAPAESRINQVSPSQARAKSWFTQNELRRRPLRPQYQTQDTMQSSFTGTNKSIRNRFMSAFGFSGNSNTPAGIKNEGQNLCFLNCVIQCLSRSPGLVEDLAQDVRDEFDCSVGETVMLTTLVEIMSQCSGKSRKVNVIDPLGFRDSVSVLNERLVAPPNERQHQQDAAEFFMWLMETLHNTLNKKSTPVEPSKESDESLKTLKFIYGDLTEQRILDLKKACRKEISEANGLKNDSYAEPIQRLSDLEWLGYKQQNRSVIDNMFTGQLVEAYHCLMDNHLTVHTQTFNILPVPIVSPRDVSGLVFLEDCFTKFCTIEHLVGKEGLECSFCKKNQGTPIIPSHVNRLKSSTRGSNSRTNIPGSVDSAIHSPKLSTSVMSPIPSFQERANDSGFQDNVFRTSTPIGEPSTRFTFPTQRLQDAERRCLLRQLPKCLVIQLLRFTYNQYSHQSRKINAPISIPLKGLDLTSIVYDNVTNREDLTASQENQNYDLYAVCVHLGAESTNCGHYVCYCQGQNGVWFKFDDELVWDVNMEYEITTREIRENAYLLFYKRSTEQTQ